MKTIKPIHYNFWVLFIAFFFFANKADLKASAKSRTSNANLVQTQISSLNENSPVKGINMLAFDLFKNLSHPNENLLFSPLCLATSFAMLYPGSMGETKAEIQRLFHFSQSSIDNSRLFNKLSNDILPKSNSSTELNMANALWIQKDFKIEQPFLEQTKNYFNSELYQQDFINSPQKSCDAMNRWISEKTNHIIEGIINANDINTLTRLILTNSIYFNGKWRDEFDKNQTKDTIFYNSDKTKSTIRMMHKTDGFNYCEDSLFQVLEIPFEDNYSMIILLPKSIKYEFVSNDFNYQNFQKWISAMTYSQVALSMPKFKLENKIQLSDILKSMGLKTAFTQQANFKGITADNVYVEKCYQSGYIAVDEEKTEATIVGITAITAMSGISQEPPIVYNMNHPFLFFILSKSSRTMLFLGKVSAVRSKDQL